MRRRAEAPARPGPCHFTPKLREAACECYFNAYHRATAVKLDRRGLPRMQSGPQGDSVLTESYTAFMAAHSRGGRLIGCPRGCSRKTYRELIRKHFKSWSKTRQCPTKSRKKLVNLTDAEAIELAAELATPTRNGQSFERFICIDDAAAARPRIAELVAKSGATSDALHRWLMHRVPTLKYKPEDRAPTLCPTTLRKRQACADVWGQRMRWFSRLSHSGAIARQCQTPTASSSRHRPHDEVDIFFDPEWYGQFGFVLDATTFSDQEGPLHDHPRCYSATDDVYPPRLVRDDKPIRQTRSIMVYAVIHKHAGVIIGPDVMLTGTKLEQSNLPKSEQLARAGVETWYVTATARHCTVMW